MEKDMEPDVKKYLRKVLYSFSYGFLWLAGNVTAGIYFGFGYKNGRPLIFSILFYLILGASLALLLRYYYRTWKK